MIREGKYTLLDRILPIYEGVLRRLGEAGATSIQMDEPVLPCERVRGNSI